MIGPVTGLFSLLHMSFPYRSWQTILQVGRLNNLIYISYGLLGHMLWTIKTWWIRYLPLKVCQSAWACFAWHWGPCPIVSRNTWSPQHVSKPFRTKIIGMVVEAVLTGTTYLEKLCIITRMRTAHISWPISRKPKSRKVVKAVVEMVTYAKGSTHHNLNLSVPLVGRIAGKRLRWKMPE